MGKFNVVFVANDMVVITEPMETKIALRVLGVVAQAYYGNGSLSEAYGFGEVTPKVEVDRLVEMLIDTAFGEEGLRCGIQWLDGRGGLFDLVGLDVRVVKTYGKYYYDVIDRLISHTKHRIEVVAATKGKG